jgi:hypothetical protein
MALQLIGDCNFGDIHTPVRSKDEWGVDVLTRRMQGASSLLAAFIATLTQGQTLQGFYLQTWDDDKHPIKPVVTLTYKGLFSGIPAPIAVNDIVQQTGSVSANFSSENGGKGFQYGIDASGAPLYAVGATREFAYFAPQTVWRYIRNGQPTGPSYSNIGFIAHPSIIKSRIVTSDGAPFGGNAPAGLVSALGLSAGLMTVGFRSVPIIGTPYFECQDIVIYGYPGG